MPTFYTVIENQMDNNGNHALLFNHYDTLEDALAKLYTILAAASKSSLPYHAGHIIESDGYLRPEGKVFDRRQS